jgi:hypothetical protein
MRWMYCVAAPDRTPDVRLMHALNRLDAKVLPRLARGVVRVGDAVRGWRVRPLTVVATTLVLAVAVTAVWRLVRPEPGGSDGTSPVWVGVREGDSIPEYVESSRARLAALAANAPARPVFALVSFGHYLRPDQVAAVIYRVPGLDSVIAYGRVPLPGRQTERISMPAERLPEDLIAGMDGVARRKEVDAGTYDTLAGEQVDQALRLIYATNAEVSRAEALAYRTACGCVFALLVKATPAVLVTLSAQVEVRAVDPEPDIDAPADAVFAPPLPEQMDRVAPPADESLSSPG